MGLSSSEDRMIVGWVFVTDTVPDCDGRSDRLSDGIYHSYSALQSKLCWRAVKIFL